MFEACLAPDTGMVDEIEVASFDLMKGNSDASMNFLWPLCLGLAWLKLEVL